jgi:hypothetical protein
MNLWDLFLDYFKIIFGFLTFSDNVCKEGFVGDQCEIGIIIDL